MKSYNQPTTQVTYVALLKTLMDSGGTVQMNIVDQGDTQQSAAMIPARRLYI